MEIRAVAPLCVTGPDGVSAAPPGPGLIVLHHRRDLLVDRPRLLSVGPETAGRLDRQGTHGSVEGDERLRGQIFARGVFAEWDVLAGVLTPGRGDLHREPDGT